MLVPGSSNIVAMIAMGIRPRAWKVRAYVLRLRRGRLLSPKTNVGQSQLESVDRDEFRNTKQ